jgi:hypothetical protein
MYVLRMARNIGGYPFDKGTVFPNKDIKSLDFACLRLIERGILIELKDQEVEEPKNASKADPFTEASHIMNQIDEELQAEKALVEKPKTTPKKTTTTPKKTTTTAKSTPAKRKNKKNKTTKAEKCTSQ